MQVFPPQPALRLRMLVDFIPNDPESALSRKRTLVAGQVYEGKRNARGGMFATRGDQAIFVLSSEYELVE